MSNAEETIDVNSRFFSILQLNGPLAPLNVNELRTDKAHWEKEGAIALMRAVYLEEACRKFLVCLSGNMVKPVRTLALEASRIDEMEHERDQLAREHYDLRKRNIRSTSIRDVFNGYFQKLQDQQTKAIDTMAASEIIRFIERMRSEHITTKEETTKKMEKIKSRLESQREYNTKLTNEIKVLTRDVENLEMTHKEMDLDLLDEKIRYAVRGLREESNV